MLRQSALVFEREVADLLVAVGYRVYGERLLSYKQVDIYAEYDILGRTQRVAVECKLSPKPLSQQQLATIVADYQPLYESNLIDQLLIITLEGATPSARAFLQAQRVAHHLTIRDLHRSAEAAGSRVQGSLPSAPLWGRAITETQRDYCFVLMPFGDTADLQAVYRDHVKPTLEGRCNLRCERADDIYDVAGVMQSVWESINRASVIVAELTGKNANVFYELGIAHTLGKPVIMISQNIDDVPLDLRHLRCILYQYKPSAVGKFEEALAKTAMSVLR